MWKYQNTDLITGQVVKIAIEVFSLYFGVGGGMGHFLPLIYALIFTSQATCTFLIPLISEINQHDDLICADMLPFMHIMKSEV